MSTEGVWLEHKSPSTTRRTTADSAVLSLPVALLYELPIVEGGAPGRVPAVIRQFNQPLPRA